MFVQWSPSPIAASSLVSATACSSTTFFFSSRRRHTSSLRDWSSDVCSSDLTGPGTFENEVAHATCQSDGCSDFRLDPSQCQDRKSTRLNSSHVEISYAVF